MVVSARPRRPYRWRHNWIPRTPGAALIKAKGSHDLAQRYMARHGVSGTTAHKPRVDEGPYFRKSGPELRDLAAKGDREAQRELDRRAARKAAAGGKVGGKREGVPFRPTAERRPPSPPEPPRSAPPSPPTAAERRAGSLAEQTRRMRERYGFDERWSVSGNYMATSATKLKPGDIINTHTDGEVVQLPRMRTGTLPTYGKTPRTVARVERVPGGVVVHFTDGTHTPTPEQARRPGYGSVVTGQTRAFGVYTDQRRSGPTSNVPKPPQEKARFGSPQHLQELNAENQRIAPPGHTIISRRSVSLGNNDPGAIISTHYDAKGNRIGSVIEWERNPGVYEAKLNGKSIGAFTDRRTAHRDLAAAHERALADQKAAEAKKSAAAAKKSAAAAKDTGGPIAWQPHTLADDGTFTSRAVQAKVKQAFRSGNKTVLIEAPMTQAQTREFLADVAAVIDKANLHGQEVTFHVPTGDRHFRTTRRGTTGAYVIRGGNTVFINPGIANNRLAASFEAGGHSGHFMPAARKVPARQYTITHELGHVLDGANGHTFTQGGFTPSGLPLPDNPAQSAGEVFRKNAGHLSRYGRTNLAESYAEAFAQWVHGGPGSSPVSDAYAARFGWPRPKTT